LLVAHAQPDGVEGKPTYCQQKHKRDDNPSATEIASASTRRLAPGRVCLD
jgi:hypothetical protein